MAKAKQSDATGGESILPQGVAELYELAPHTLAEFVTAELGHVELKHCTIDMAERLEKAGYLIKK